MSISPSLSPRQCPDRYAFRAGRNLPDKEFRYLRTVIVTAAVHRGFGRRLPCHQVTNFLDLPALGRRQPPYVVLRLRGDLCFGKQSPGPGHCDPPPLYPFVEGRSSFSWEYGMGYFSAVAPGTRTLARGIFSTPSYPALKKAKVFGALDSHQCLRYSSRHSRFRFVHTCSRGCFPLRRNAPLPMHFTSHSFGRSLSPVHLRRKSARSVSYYALFQGWLLLGKPPGCLCTLPPLSLSGHLGALAGDRAVSLSTMKLIPIVSLADLDPLGSYLVFRVCLDLTRFRYGSGGFLNQATAYESPAHSSTGTRSEINSLLPLLGSSRFHVLFHSPMGVLSPFPHGTTSLSVTQEYLALQGGPCGFTRDSTCPMLLGSERKLVMLSATGLSPSRVQYSTASPSSTTLVLLSHNPVFTV
ncbi:hypothetical protein H6P81_021506 [Aristolochia fimbriata]|uniref:Uncharacterized protein n=1 Tax=Aristolochia fimbriata TaxID=158543 RepID=A0AAV7DPS1_ARIFI|nr:hypothetical protein H6P81_021506 [Aristolochia fimbriata]